MGCFDLMGALLVLLLVALPRLSLFCRIIAVLRDLADVAVAFPRHNIGAAGDGMVCLRYRHCLVGL